MRVFLLSGLLLPLLLVPPVQRPRPIPPAEKNQETFFLKGGDYSLRDLLEKSADFLGYVYILPPSSDSKGRRSDKMSSSKVRIDKDLKLGRRECEDVMSQLAFSFGWGRTPLDAKNGIYQWVRLDTQERYLAKARAPFVDPEEILARPNLCEVVYTTLPLKNADARQMASTLRPIFSDPVSFLQVLSAGDSNSLVLTGTRKSLAGIIRMVREADLKGTTRKSSMARELGALKRRIAALETRVRALEMEAGKGKK